MASLNPSNGVLGTRKAAHLLRRTTFGPTRAMIEAYAAMIPDEAVTALLDIQPITTKPIDYLTGKTWVDNYSSSSNSTENLLKRFVVSWWLDNARRDNTILHKMILFLHQTWITTYENVDSELYYDYLKLIEYYGLGNFKTLAYKMCFNNSMLIYLDGGYNTRTDPNENFAREFLEMFTIGKTTREGVRNYSENDIKEAAKIFTGFRWAKNNEVADSETGLRVCTVDISKHNRDDKFFGDAFQNTTIHSATTSEGIYTEVQQFVDLVFAQEEVSKNICRKLYRFFVNRKIDDEIETQIITPLATQLRNENYELKEVIKRLLKSKHFYDEDDDNKKDEIIGSQIKSPADLLFGTMRFFNIQPPDAVTNTFNHYQDFYREAIQGFFMDGAGFKLFHPDNVAGYPAYYREPDYDRLWINTSTLVIRYTLPRMILENRRILANGYFYVTFDLLAWINNPENISDPGDGTKLVDEIIRYVFPENPTKTERFDFFLNDILLGNLSLTNWRMEWDNYKTSGNSASILPQLKQLFKSILFSQEYQLQ
ncbi:MAG: DUF1800 family protein [Chitinophagaceae bacterium]|nr:DUF1800 family protein [Chitinophagaceae bacterium]